MRISDWSSDVCSSDLTRLLDFQIGRLQRDLLRQRNVDVGVGGEVDPEKTRQPLDHRIGVVGAAVEDQRRYRVETRSEEHTSELQSLMRISYAVFCLQNKNYSTTHTLPTHRHTHSQH